MIDRDALINSVIDHVADSSNSLLGMKLGTASKALIKVVANNYLSNSEYGKYVDMMFDAEGNFLCDAETYFDTLREFISQKPVELFGMKFNSKDIDDIEKIFNKK
jgi:hypothetical protein